MKYAYNLTAVIGIKNEAPYLAQWIEFHVMQGFDHFFIYDNASTDNFLEILGPYIGAGLVTVIPIPRALHQRQPGLWVIHDSILKVTGVSRWHWIASIDEYLFTFGKAGFLKLPEYLSHYEDDKIASLAVCWQLFHSDVKEWDFTKLVIERFTEGIEEAPPWHVKNIVRPERIMRIRDPHSFTPMAPYISVNENRDPCPSAHPPYVTMETIRINHYCFMSKDEYTIKMSKGRTDIAGGEDRLRDGTWDLWNAAAAAEHFTDSSLHRWVQPLKDALEKRWGVKDV